MLFTELYTTIANEKELNHVCKELNIYFARDTTCLEKQRFSDEAIHEFVIKTKALYKKVYDKEFPDNPKEQLIHYIEEVFKSCDSKRAQIYRRINEIDGIICAAAVVQKMVFGNAGDNSGVGYLYTRNPKTGENKAFTKILKNTQRKNTPYYYNIYDNKDDSGDLSENCFDKLITEGKTRLYTIIINSLNL